MSAPSGPASPSPNSGGSRGVHVPGVSPAQKRAIGTTPSKGSKVKPGRKPPAAPKPQPSPKRRGK